MAHSPFHVAWKFCFDHSDCLTASKSNQKEAREIWSVVIGPRNGLLFEWKLCGGIFEIVFLLLVCLGCVHWLPRIRCVSMFLKNICWELDYENIVVLILEFCEVLKIELRDRRNGILKILKHFDFEKLCKKWKCISLIRYKLATTEW